MKGRNFSVIFCLIFLINTEINAAFSQWPNSDTTFSQFSDSKECSENTRNLECVPACQAIIGKIKMVCEKGSSYTQQEQLNSITRLLGVMREVFNAKNQFDSRERARKFEKLVAEPFRQLVDTGVLGALIQSCPDDYKKFYEEVMVWETFFNDKSKQDSRFRPLSESIAQWARELRWLMPKEVSRSKPTVTMAAVGPTALGVDDEVEADLEKTAVEPCSKGKVSVCESGVQTDLIDCVGNGSLLQSMFPNLSNDPRFKTILESINKILRLLSVVDNLKYGDDSKDLRHHFEMLQNILKMLEGLIENEKNSCEKEQAGLEKRNQEMREQIDAQTKKAQGLFAAIREIIVSSSLF